MNMLTVPKVRDLIYRPQQQYMELVKNINSNTEDKNNSKDNDDDAMSCELKKYVEELNTNN